MSNQTIARWTKAPINSKPIIIYESHTGYIVVFPITEVEYYESYLSRWWQILPKVALNIIQVSYQVRRHYSHQFSVQSQGTMGYIPHPKLLTLHQLVLPSSFSHNDSNLTNAMSSRDTIPSWAVAISNATPKINRVSLLLFITAMITSSNIPLPHLSTIILRPRHTPVDTPQATDHILGPPPPLSTGLLVAE